MLITFVVSNTSMKVGSYRIWIHDFSKYLEKSSIDGRPVRTAIVNNAGSVPAGSDVVIFSKGDYRFASSFRNSYDGTIGAINVSASEATHKGIDFVIVGSIEERISLTSKYENVFIVNLIEEMHNHGNIKEHEDKDCLVLGIHGSYTHIPKLQYGFIQAVEELNSETPNSFEILSVSNEKDKALEFFRSMGIKNTKLECREWSFERFTNDLTEMDIGIVCNSTNLMQMYPDLTKVHAPEIGIYDSDYSMRFKNKSNPGRAFVFFQNGIPVVADLTPSHLPILHNEDNGYIAFDKSSWKIALNNLRKKEVRQLKAINALKSFHENYSMLSDAEKLLKNIMEINSDSNN